MKRICFCAIPLSMLKRTFFKKRNELMKIKSRKNFDISMNLTQDSCMVEKHATPVLWGLCYKELKCMCRYVKNYPPQFSSSQIIHQTVHSHYKFQSRVPWLIPLTNASPIFTPQNDHIAYLVYQPSLLVIIAWDDSFFLKLFIKIVVYFLTKMSTYINCRYNCWVEYRHLRRQHVHVPE